MKTLHSIGDDGIVKIPDFCSSKLGKLLVLDKMSFIRHGY
jgi:hypothetical protein